MERKIAKIYKQSNKEIVSKWTAYMERQSAKISGIEEKYKAAVKAGQKKEAKKLLSELTAKKKAVTLQSEKYQEMVRQTAEKIAKANEAALAYVNKQLPQIYSINYNAIADGFGKVSGISFDLANESAIRYMIKEDPNLLPTKKLNIKKDVRWNTKKINSSVLQGIIQGESMPTIARRLTPIMDGNTSAAIRNARTMVTSAENKGKLDRLEELTERGVVLVKVWKATHDDRTRISHALLDGEEAEMDEAFSNGLMYPADPSGEPEEVYNCRCGMLTKVIGFKKDDGRVEGVSIKGYEPDYEFEQLG